MENVLNKESVKRVDKDLKTFDLKLNITQNTDSLGAPWAPS